ncbi:hypothetical protein HGB13_04940, partial [bacterium]|nr:hypothetical protein [bacterium]
MEHLKYYDEYNEAFSLKKAIVGGALIAGLAGGGAYMHDRAIEPTEINQSVHKDIPNDFSLKQKILTIGTDMYITNGNKDNFGKVEERVVSVSKKFQYFDNTHKLLATANERIFTLYDKIDITDENGAPIGSVEEEILESLTSLYSIYTIRDKDDNILAKSKKLSLLTTDVEIYDLDGNSIAKFHKRYLSSLIAASWDINITGDIDKRLVIFIPSFITSSQSRQI